MSEILQPGHQPYRLWNQDAKSQFVEGWENQRGQTTFILYSASVGVPERTGRRWVREGFASPAGGPEGGELVEPTSPLETGVYLYALPTDSRLIFEERVHAYREAKARGTLPHFPLQARLALDGADKTRRLNEDMGYLWGQLTQLIQGESETFNTAIGYMSSTLEGILPFWQSYNTVSGELENQKRTHRQDRQFHATRLNQLSSGVNGIIREVPNLLATYQDSGGEITPDIRTVLEILSQSSIDDPSFEEHIHELRSLLEPVKASESEKEEVQSTRKKRDALSKEIAQYGWIDLAQKTPDGELKNLKALKEIYWSPYIREGGIRGNLPEPEKQFHNGWLLNNFGQIRNYVNAKGEARVQLQDRLQKSEEYLDGMKSKIFHANLDHMMSRVADMAARRAGFNSELAVIDQKFAPIIEPLERELGNLYAQLEQLNPFELVNPEFHSLVRELEAKLFSLVPPGQQEQVHQILYS